MQLPGDEHSQRVGRAAADDLLQNSEDLTAQFSVPVWPVMAAALNAHNRAGADPLHINVCARQRVKLRLRG